MIAKFKGKAPVIDDSVFIASSADVIGDVTIGAHSSVWFNAVVRGDVHYIKIGEYTNVQDNCTLHVTNGVAPLNIGSRVTIGHQALLHGCTVEDDCLIGMGAVILDDAVIRRGSVVAAGSVVPPGKEYPENSLIIGSPAKFKREITKAEFDQMITEGYQNYHGYIKDYLESFEIIQP